MRFPKRKLIRAVEDYHVDRTEVEAQQCVELTVTNSPFGLTIKFILHTDADSAITRCVPSILRPVSSRWPTILGDCSEGVTPVPIPNTAVKPLSPDGTARASVWESRTSPN